MIPNLVACDHLLFIYFFLAQREMNCLLFSVPGLNEIKDTI